MVSTPTTSPEVSSGTATRSTIRDFFSLVDSPPTTMRFAPAHAAASEVDEVDDVDEGDDEEEDELLPDSDDNAAMTC